MKCQKCGCNTNINWGDSNFILCKNHSDLLNTLKHSDTVSQKIIKPEKEQLKGYLLFTSLIALTSGLVLLFPSMMSVMAFDATGSEKQITTWIVFLCLFTFSPICILSIIASWILYACNEYRFAKIIALSPLINVSILFVLFSFSYIIETPSRLADFKIEREKRTQRVDRLNSLCADNLINIYSKVDNTKSLYFSNYRMNEAWWLWREKLDFVETRHFDTSNNPVYSRTIKDLTPQEEGSGVSPTIRMKIEKPQAQYELHYGDVSNEIDKKNGIQITEYSLKDRQNNQVIANYTIVKSKERVCPSIDHHGGRILSYVLGTMKAIDVKKFEIELSNYSQ